MRDETRARAVLPVNLLVTGRPCMVVGGGTIAARKVGHLLDAEASVTVVSPQLSDVLDELSKHGRVQHLARAFYDGDVEGQWLVFAVTDDADVNRRVLTCCRERGILCSAADANWPAGDAIMPAICRDSGITVTVSTGGQSCRLARTIKDRLRDIIKAIVAEESAENDDNGK